MYERTLALYPQSVAARVSLASFDKQQGRYEHAIKLLRDGLGKQDNVQLRMELGNVYAKQGRVQDSWDEFQKAAKLEPNNPEPHVAMGILLEYTNDDAKATEEYRKAVEMDPSYVSARNHLGTMLLEAGNLADAEAQFREALKWNPNAEGVLYNLSLILDKTDRRDEARKLLERANALLPGDARITKALSEHSK
jgi:Flp pilus assembly protein TadD